MIKYNYFFGSDERSVPFLSTLSKKIPEIKVVTTHPNRRGRGRKFLSNPVEKFCEENNINYVYFDENIIYHDMSFGIVASFSKIFPYTFLDNNSSLFNIHLSLLPKYRGPTPVENAILNNEIVTGYTVFKIDKHIDTGKIIFQNKLSIENKYSSEIYKEIFQLFDVDFHDIDFQSQGTDQSQNTTLTKKFIKSDFNITTTTVKNAKIKIRAFDTLGPAFVEFNNRILKIHTYSDQENKSSIELTDGLLYPVKVTPEGKRTMIFEDYLRGLK